MFTVGRGFLLFRRGAFVTITLSPTAGVRYRPHPDAPQAREGTLHSAMLRAGLARSNPIRGNYIRS